MGDVRGEGGGSGGGGENRENGWGSIQQCMFSWGVYKGFSASERF